MKRHTAKVSRLQRCFLTAAASANHRLRAWAGNVQGQRVRPTLTAGRRCNTSVVGLTEIAAEAEIANDESADPPHMADITTRLDASIEAVRLHTAVPQEMGNEATVQNADGLVNSDNAVQTPAIIAKHTEPATCYWTVLLSCSASIGAVYLPKRSGYSRCGLCRKTVYVCRAKVQSIRPFGVFVALQGYRRHGMVHSSQVSNELSLTREDEDDAKVKAMEFFLSSIYRGI